MSISTRPNFSNPNCIPLQTEPCGGDPQPKTSIYLRTPHLLFIIVCLSLVNIRKQKLGYGLYPHPSINQ